MNEYCKKIVQDVFEKQKTRNVDFSFCLFWGLFFVCFFLSLFLSLFLSFFLFFFYLAFYSFLICFLFIHTLHVLIAFNKGNNKITELRTILQRESQNS
jgi:hypothetical protein